MKASQMGSIFSVQKNNKACSHISLTSKRKETQEKKRKEKKRKGQEENKT